MAGIARWGWLAALLVLGVLVASGGAWADSPVESSFADAAFGLSPDGRLLAYPLLAYEPSGDPVTEVWIAKVDGTRTKRLGSVPGLWSLSWCGPGRIAALSLEEPRMYRFSLQGGEPEEIPFGGDYYWMIPSVSPEGARVALTACLKKDPEEAGVWLVDGTARAPRKLFSGLVRSAVAWSPDGRRLAFGVGDYGRDYRLMVVDVATGKATDTGLNGTAVSWLPNGASLSYVGEIVGRTIWRGTPVGGRLLKTNLRTRQTVALTAPAERHGTFGARWSPDGTRVAYYRQRFVMRAADMGKAEPAVWVAAAGGTKPRKVADGLGPVVWAKDGKSLFVKSRNGIARYPVAGGTPRRVITWTLPTAPEPKESDYQTLRTEGAEVRYLGVPEAYAKAVLTTAATARRIYADTLHCDLPAVVGATMTKSASQRTALWTDGESQFFLVVKSVKDLAPPQQSGVFNLYGFCHELGHIVMYRRIKLLGLPDGIGEGWAHYAGSVVLDEVYKECGESLWPIPYDYRADGTARLAKQADREDPTGKAAGAFWAAHQHYGRDAVFAAMNAASEGKPYGRDLMPRFAEALVKLTGDPKAKELFPAELLSSKVEWNTAAHPLTAQTTAGQMEAEDETGLVLKYDAGRGDGMRSTAGSGHAVVFRRPEGAWAVDGVSMYGMRYGADEAPKVNFSIFVCDQDFTIIKEIEEPYGALSYGEKPSWNQFTFDPVAVPEAFYVCVYFDPTFDRGFYMHFEKGHKQNHSYAALPMSFVSDAPEGDWMIRVHLKK